MSAKGTPSTRKRSRTHRPFLDRNHPLARILDLAGAAIISVNRRRSIIFYNHVAEKMFGYSEEEITGRPLDLLLPARLARVRWEHIEKRDKSRTGAQRDTERWEILGRRKDGTEFPAEASLSKLVFEGQTLFTYIMRDVTPQTPTEERLRAALREKEVLLEEVHHRVKNNLQVITSLLGLQARSIKDATTRKKFEESRYRIQAMAILHEILYESASLTAINFADYIRRLAEHLVRSYGATGRIRLQVHLDPLDCHRDVALPCGLIVNELLSNAFKYAFPGSRSGEIRMELRRASKGLIHLMIGDNGVGLPDGFDFKTSRTLGLRLVRTLAGQIDAEVKTSGCNGTIFSITFLDGLPILTD